MMHAILGLTKNIYKWMLKLYARLGGWEEGKMTGNTTHHFRQGIMEARDNAIEYCEFRIPEERVSVDRWLVEGKRVDNMNVMKEIEKN